MTADLFRSDVLYLKEGATPQETLHLGSFFFFLVPILCLWSNAHFSFVQRSIGKSLFPKCGTTLDLCGPAD